MKKLFIALCFSLIVSFLPLSQSFFSITEIASAQGTTQETCSTEDLKKGYCIELSEKLGQDKVIKGANGLDLIYNYLGTIYKYIASIVGIICVAIIVFSGIQISLGGVSSESVSTGKSRIMNALISLILVFGTGLLLRTINPGFFVTEPLVTTKQSVSSGGGTTTNSDDPKPPVKKQTITVDGKFGNQTRDAYANEANRAIRLKYPNFGDYEADGSGFGCDASNSNCGGVNADVRAFQEECNAQPKGCVHAVEFKKAVIY